MPENQNLFWKRGFSSKLSEDLQTFELQAYYWNFIQMMFRLKRKNDKCEPNFSLFLTSG